MDDFHKNEDKHMKYPLYIIIFPKDSNSLTIKWIIDILQKDQINGGAELIVKNSKTSNKETVLGIYATPLRLLEAAEILEICKEDKYGKKCEFVLSSMDLFLKPGQDKNNFLTSSEKQKIVLNEIMALHLTKKTRIFGYSDVYLYPGQSLVQVCKDMRIIEQIFPLHDQKELEAILPAIYTFPYTIQKLSKIQSYFGDKIAFYFAFLVFYTLALIPPCVIGVIQIFFSSDFAYLYIFFSIFKMMWLTLFLELWKRRCSELAFSFGTLQKVSLPTSHPTFRGTSVQRCSLTQQMVPAYPSYKRHFKVYCVSTPITAFCIMFAIYIMFIYFSVEHYIVENFDASTNWFNWILIQLPGITYSIIVIILSSIFRRLAKFLTEWENHRTQESYENHLITKLIV